MYYFLLRVFSVWRVWVLDYMFRFASDKKSGEERRRRVCPQTLLVLAVCDARCSHGQAHSSYPWRQWPGTRVGPGKIEAEDIELRARNAPEQRASLLRGSIFIPF